MPEISTAERSKALEDCLVVNQNKGTTKKLLPYTSPHPQTSNFPKRNSIQPALRSPRGYNSSIPSEIPSEKQRTTSSVEVLGIEQTSPQGRMVKEQQLLINSSKKHN